MMITQYILNVCESEVQTRDERHPKNEQWKIVKMSSVLCGTKRTKKDKWKPVECKYLIVVESVSLKC